jgi:predicted dehydrogenase
MKNNIKAKDTMVIGAGKIGTIRAKIAKELSPRSIIYIFDTDFIKAEILAKEVNGVALKKLSAGLENKDIKNVVISVVNKFGKKLAIEAIKAGKNVLLEKPMGRNFSEAKDISLVARKYKKVFKCGFNHRYHPAILKAHELCKKKTIGELLFIRGAYGHGGRNGYEKEWRASKDLCGGGELLDQGCHLIDLSLWFFNFEEVKRSECFANPMFYPMEVDDNAFCMFQTKSGKVAQIHATWTQWKNLFRFEVYGTKGAIEINGLGKSYGIETLKLYKRIKPGAPPSITEIEFKGEDISWKSEWKDFLKAITRNKKSMSNENESLAVMRLISDLYRKNK